VRLLEEEKGKEMKQQLYTLITWDIIEEEAKMKDKEEKEKEKYNKSMESNEDYNKKLKK